MRTIKLIAFTLLLSIATPAMAFDWNSSPNKDIDEWMHRMRMERQMRELEWNQQRMLQMERERCTQENFERIERGELPRLCP